MSNTNANTQIYLLGNKDTALSSFTKYELDLVMVSQVADERTKENALNMLAFPPCQEGKSTPPE